MEKKGKGGWVMRKRLSADEDCNKLPYISENCEMKTCANINQYTQGGVMGSHGKGKIEKKTKKSKRKTSPTQVYLLLKPGCRLDFMFMNQLRNVPLQLVLPFETRMQDKRGGTLPV